MIYDFTKGLTADYLLNKLRGQFTVQSDFEIVKFEAIPHEKISIKGKSFIYRNGVHEYYMFAYKQRFSTIKFQTLPRFHITDCETRDAYTGFRFSNKMPVNIYCIDQREDIGPQTLDLCKNCHKKLNFFSFGNDEFNWFEVILRKAADRDYSEEDLRIDGYTRDWNQVSKAYRYKHGFICEKCGIDLSDRNAAWFCEVHHVDHNKSNNSLHNLKCLCIRCHANVDDRHRANYAHGDNKKKLNQFDIFFPKPKHEEVSNHKIF